MSELKFVVLRVTNGGMQRDMPFVFSAEIVHADFAANLAQHLTHTHKASAVEVVSAGSCRIDEVDCFGSSETLRSNARGEDDERLIRTMPYLHGITNCY